MSLPSAAPLARELSPDQQVEHVLNRLAFGPRPGDVAKVQAMGVDQWIDQQLQPEKIVDRASEAVTLWYAVPEPRPVNPAVAAARAQQALQQAKIQVAARGGDSSKVRPVATPLPAQVVTGALTPQQEFQRLEWTRVARAVTSERQLNEIMVEFWENHFSVYVNKGQDRPYLVSFDQDVIRPHAMGKFRDLLGAVAHSPAMLEYLDNVQNRADGLHPTLDKMTIDGGVQNTKVGTRFIAPNKAFTDACSGIGTEKAPALVAQLPPETRKLLAASTPVECARMVQPYLNQKAYTGTTRAGLNENYARELMELHTLGVDGGYTQQDVIEVARALTGWTVTRAPPTPVPGQPVTPPEPGEFEFRPNMHDATEKHVLGHTIQQRRGIEDGEQVLDILARHPSTAKFITTKLARRLISDDPPPSVITRCAQRFTATDGDIRETVRCIVTSPEFFSKAAYRAKVKTPFELVASSIRAVNGQLDGKPGLAQPVTQLGQPMFGRSTPDGWPDRADAWMNTGAILNRINFGVLLAGGGIPGVVLPKVSELESVRTAPREQQAEALSRLFYGGDISPETRQILIGGENPLVAKAGGRHHRDPLRFAGRAAPDPAPGARADDRPRARRAGVPTEMIHSPERTGNSRPSEVP